MPSSTAQNPIEQFLAKLADSVAGGTFVQLRLSAPGKTENTPEKILVRCVDLKGALYFSLTFRFARRDETKNLPVVEGAAWLRERLGRDFFSALLRTTERDWQLHLSPQGGARLVRHPPAPRTAPSRAHDLAKKTWLDHSAHDWLHGLGVVDATGRVVPAMADKHRQIGRYVEILSHLARDCGWNEPPGSPLVFADMGCGKGYLTFATWQLFHRVWQRPIHIFGVENRPDLAAATQDLARKIGADNLEFTAGTIQSTPLPRLDALLALHACNTATDDAIRRGVALGAKLLVVSPCCHQELRPQLSHAEPFAAVLRHGVMAERMAEWLTDGLRALFLEWAGYRTKIFEFIAAEHTPKNLMISAVKEREPFVETAVKERIENLKAFFGIQQHALDALLAETPPKRT